MQQPPASRWVANAAVVFATFAMSPLAIAQGNEVRGEALAQVWCANCHIVNASQATANADVPSFFDIAKRADGDFDPLAAFLTDPHPPMPNFNLSRNEISDLLAYIGTLN